MAGTVGFEEAADWPGTAGLLEAIGFEYCCLDMLEKFPLDIFKNCGNMGYILGEWPVAGQTRVSERCTEIVEFLSPVGRRIGRDNV